MCKTEAAIRTQRAGPGMKGQALAAPGARERRPELHPTGSLKDGGAVRAPAPTQAKKKVLRGPPTWSLLISAQVTV